MIIKFSTLYLSKRPYMFSDDSLKRLIETHNPDEDFYSSSKNEVQ